MKNIAAWTHHPATVGNGIHATGLSHVYAHAATVQRAFVGCERLWHITAITRYIYRSTDVYTPPRIE